MSHPHGIHHVTAIAGDPQENLDFYAGILGMRLVKRSVNQDDPHTYHLFYADAAGHPGADLTFFPWTRMAPGRPGTGLTVETSLAVPSDALVGWGERLERYGVQVGSIERRHGEEALPFVDPHGLRLALVGTDDERDFTPWEDGPVAPERQVRGIHAVRLHERDLRATTAFLEEAMGFAAHGVDGGWHRFGAGGGGSGRWIEIREIPDGRPGAWGTGSVHHVAWRVTDEDAQRAVRRRVAEAGPRPTPVIDRFWFRSVYFREPGGALFELATDGPGFTVDEPLDRLGESLILPPWLEERRADIESALPPLAAPDPVVAS